MSTLETVEEIARANGFESVAEAWRLIASLDMSTPAKVEAFKAWQFLDGTKAGLLKAIKDNEA